MDELLGGTVLRRGWDRLTNLLIAGDPESPLPRSYVLAAVQVMIITVVVGLTGPWRPDFLVNVLASLALLGPTVFISNVLIVKSKRRQRQVRLERDLEPLVKLVSKRLERGFLTPIQHWMGTRGTALQIHQQEGSGAAQVLASTILNIATVQNTLLRMRSGAGADEVPVGRLLDELQWMLRDLELEALRVTDRLPSSPAVLQLRRLVDVCRRGWVALLDGQAALHPMTDFTLVGDKAWVDESHVVIVYARIAEVARDFLVELDQELHAALESDSLGSKVGV